METYCDNISKNTEFLHKFRKREKKTKQDLLFKA